ncbi:MAG TPA: hypothetical protein DCY31_02150, partial [Ruminococcaceae bacterium]|nr:hypothetical protein [Oscillospiraceae bacterium]
MNRIFKKFLSLAIALVMVFPVLTVNGFAANNTDALKYSVKNGEVTIIGCDNSVKGDLVIPSEIKGYPVTSIGDGAFYRCMGLLNVTIPNSVVSIGESAFIKCSGLKKVTMSDKVTKIDDYAFSECTSLDGIVIPDSVTSLGIGIF